MASPAEEIQPDPGSLIESLRDFGYTLQSALADLIDNSLTAGAKNISVELDASSDAAAISVLDDGSGMTLPRLLQAMQMGGLGPQAVRHAADLGRFGLGLKTASLSQGKCLTVISRVKGADLAVRKWDISFIKSTGKWQLLDDLTPLSRQLYDRLAKQASGTAVVIEKLDRVTFLRVAPSDLDQHFGRTLELVRKHLGMVFHRFLEKGVVIRLGSNPVKAWDPFFRTRSTSLAPEQLILAGKAVGILPYVLPHHSKMTDEEHDAIGGPLGWNAHQGFYIYRCDRLIVPGTWLNLSLRKEEHFKLARIAIDLPNTMDADWHLNVMKSHVAAPSLLAG